MLSSKLLVMSVIATALLFSGAIGQELMVEPKRSVEVIEGSENLLHLRPTDYPSFLREQGVQGTEALEVTLDEKGHVMDAQVVSGPTKLRWLALKYVLDWHFAPPTSMPSTVKVSSNGSCRLEMNRNRKANIGLGRGRGCWRRPIGEMAY